MSNKEFLSQAFYLDKLINIKIAKAAEMRRCLRYKTTNYEKDGSQNGGHQNSMENAILKVHEYEEKINEEVDKLIALKCEIEKAIASIQECKRREILERRYLLLQKWEVIAVTMNIDLRWIHRLHNSALNSLTIASH